MIFCVLRSPQFPSVKVNPRQEGLAVEDAAAAGLVAAAGLGAGTSKLRKQAAPLYLRRNLQPDGAQNRGHQIDERNRIGNGACRGLFRKPILWQSNDQR